MFIFLFKYLFHSTINKTQKKLIRFEIYVKQKMMVH